MLILYILNLLPSSTVILSILLKLLHFLLTFIHLCSSPPRVVLLCCPYALMAPPLGKGGSDSGRWHAWQACSCTVHLQLKTTQAACSGNLQGSSCMHFNVWALGKRSFITLLLPPSGLSRCCVIPTLLFSHNGRDKLVWDRSCSEKKWV